MSTLDFTFAPLAALACFAVYVWLLFKFPTGVIFIGFTTYGIAWVSFGPLNYARAVFALQVFSAIFFIYQVFKTMGTDRLVRFLGTKYSLFLWFLVFIWAKIGFDILYSGVDDFRMEGLKIFAQTVLLPAIVFFMAAVGSDPWRFATGIMVGMVAFAVAFVAPTIPGMIAEGRLASSLFGIDRLTIYNMDTINGGRFFFMGVLGAMTLLIGGGFGRFGKFLLIALSVSFFVLLMLNGTRQYIIGVLVAGVMCSYSFIRTSGVLKFGLIAIVLGVAGYFSFNIFAAAEVTERFSGDSLSTELAVSRGTIWLRVWEAGIEQPLTGMGFRRFGDVIMIAGQASDADMVANLSGAHGFFQDIWAEHGAVLATIGFLLFGFSIYQMLIRIQVEQHSVVWAHYSALVGMVVPLFMSGAVFSSGAMYFLALSMYVVFAKHKIDQAQQHVAQIVAQRQAIDRKRELDVLMGRI